MYIENVDQHVTNYDPENDTDFQQEKDSAENIEGIEDTGPEMQQGLS